MLACWQLHCVADLKRLAEGLQKTLKRISNTFGKKHRADKKVPRKVLHQTHTPMAVKVYQKTHQEEKPDEYDQ